MKYRDSFISFLKKCKIAIAPFVTGVAVFVWGTIQRRNFNSRMQAMGWNFRIKGYGRINPLKWLIGLDNFKQDVAFNPLLSSFVVAGVVLLISLAFSAKYLASKEIYKDTRLQMREKLRGLSSENSDAGDSIVEGNSGGGIVEILTNDLPEVKTPKLEKVSSDRLNKLTVFEEPGKYDS
ncbi:MAG: hypothetical protein NC393_10295 [Clostridium sp.]|nr:hypothetical protein [Clostridium sp.]MCM1207492.1 hypothetical protein [Ruminococcus sp.]